jgi:hypothetical protein
MLLLWPLNGTKVDGSGTEFLQIMTDDVHSHHLCQLDLDQSQSTRCEFEASFSGKGIAAGFLGPFGLQP